MMNYVTNFYLKSMDIMKIDDVLFKINNGLFNQYEVDNINLLKISKKFPDNYTVSLEVNYDDFIDDLEFSVTLQSPDKNYIKEVTTTKSFNNSYFFEGDDNLYSIYILNEEDKFVVENILDIVLAENNKN